MKKIKILLFVSIFISFFLVLTNFQVLAIPTLQLDILGGTYDPITETIIAPSSYFTLYAYLIPNESNTLGDYYYISAALIPMVTPPGSNLGFFTFSDQKINVTENMVYGVPPLEAILGTDGGDLASHGIFETYFTQFQFRFSSENQIVPYNTQDRAISKGSIPTTGGGMYFVRFEVNTSNLGGGYVIHFDLYNTTLNTSYDSSYSGDVDVSKFAPFSHDAQSMSVPEPSTLLLLGSGLMGAWFFGRRKFKI